MSTTRRRCLSEQIPSPAKRPIPPHKAAQLRQAQLREAQKQLPLPTGIGRKLQVETEHKDEKEAIGPHISFSLPKSLPKQSNTGPKEDPQLARLADQKSSGCKVHEQGPGANVLPSIDAIIQQSEDRDKRRRLGEIGFHEHTGEDSIIQRRSMMRTVDKDDCLIGRGANPRTGLVTPDWNSIAGSLDSDHVHPQPRGRPSAQWRLEGDSWVSVPKGKTKDSFDVSQADVERSHPQAGRAASGSSAGRPPGSNTAAALTEDNLRTFSDRYQPQQASRRDVSGEADPIPRVDKIRRKPVAGVDSASFTNVPEKSRHRNVSDGTVIHGPRVKNGTTGTRPYPEYYSPDAVGRGLSRNDATGFPKRSKQGGPFLGLPAESRSDVIPTIRDFRGRLAFRDQLEQSLRTSNGPYPSPPSKQRSIPQTAVHRLNKSRIQREAYMPHANDTKVSMTVHQPAPRACPLGDVTSFDHTGLQRQHQGSLQVGPWNRRTQPHRERTVDLDFQERSSSDPEAQVWLNTTYMNTDIHTPMSRKQASEAPQRQHDRALSRQDTYRDLLHCTDNHLEDIEEPTKERPITAPTQLENTVIEQKLRGRPSMGARSQAMLRIPKPRDHLTDTVLKNPLNRIGIREPQPDGEDESVDVDQPIKGGELPYPTGMSVPAEAISPATSDQLVLYDTNRISMPKMVTRDMVDICDHSVCCPQCCITFDCHGGCLGHPSPGVSNSETASLVSMGVFDANFETSVKAVNEALLTPSDRPEGKLAKIRTAFGWRSGATPPQKMSPRPSTMKRTLRDDSLSQKVNVGLDRPGRPVIKGPRQFAKKDAKAAAIKAFDIDGGSKENLLHSRKVQTEAKVKLETKVRSKTTARQKQPHLQVEANESRRIVSKGSQVSGEFVSELDKSSSHSSETTLVESEVEPGAESDSGYEAVHLSRCEDHRSEPISMLDKLNAFIREKSNIARPRGIGLNMMTNPALLNYACSITLKVRDMAMIVAETGSIIAAMVFEYNRSGLLALPEGVCPSELLGDTVRSILYLMVAACVYALVVKVGRIILGILRIVLLPVRVCAWIVG